MYNLLCIICDTQNLWCITCDMQNLWCITCDTQKLMMHDLCCTTCDAGLWCITCDMHDYLWALRIYNFQNIQKISGTKKNRLCWLCGPPVTLHARPSGAIMRKEKMEREGPRGRPAGEARWHLVGSIASNTSSARLDSRDATNLLILNIVVLSKP